MVLRGAFKKKRRWDICWFRIVEEIIEVLGERLLLQYWRIRFMSEHVR